MVYRAEHNTLQFENDPTGLIGQAMAADEAAAQPAFQELAEHYEAPLRRYVLGIVKRTEIAQDIVQQTFLRAWEKRAAFQQSGNFRAWLYKIAERLALDTLRRGDDPRSRSLDQMQLDAGYEVADPRSDNNEDAIGTKELIDKALVILAQTTQDSTVEIMRARYLNDDSRKTIAIAFNIPMREVDVVLSRGREKLKSIIMAMSEKGYQPEPANQSFDNSPQEIAATDRDRIEQALKHISNPAAATALRLNLIDNLPAKIIADQLGRSANAISLLLSGYRPALAKLLGGTIPELHSVTPRLDRLLRTDPSHERLEAVLQQISNQRTVQTLHSHLIDGLSGTQISQQTDEPENTVRVRILRGKEKLEELQYYPIQ